MPEMRKFQPRISSIFYETSCYCLLNRDLFGAFLYLFLFGKEEF
jgi:hypothetical protein